jgi:hypothetical protein
MISKTGDVPGGAIMATAGLDYGEYRLDFDYGAKLTDTLRFHIGGFYHQVQGPRRVSYDGTKGGQIKLNVTKEFRGGYMRFYGKFLNDRSAAYLPNPVRVTGTNADPRYGIVPGFSIARDALLSRYDTSNVTLDGQNNPVVDDIRDGQHPMVNAFVVETRFEGSGWTVTDRFRYLDISGQFISNFPSAVDGAAATARHWAARERRCAMPAAPITARRSRTRRGRTATVCLRASWCSTPSSTASTLSPTTCAPAAFMTSARAS